jgi:hypothetical protein
MSNCIRVVFLISILASAYAQNKSAPKTAAMPPASGSEDYNRLPVQRVVLYKNGVGYFEHSARVRGRQELNIDFTTSQLNDVLKSLTVVDLGEGRISSGALQLHRSAGGASESVAPPLRRGDRPR